MKGIISRSFFFIIFVSIGIKATTYYVDYENGSDNHNGLSETYSWKHAPGDTAATSNPEAAVLNPGDTVSFKGGVIYRGTITMVFGYSGTEDFPIVYKGDGWGEEKAIIDGSDILPATWTACQSAEEVSGNPNWNNIYYTTISGKISPFTQIFENSERAYIAQTPNMTDPFWDDEISEYQPVSPANITITSITDPSFLDQPDTDFWNGGYIQIWVLPNIIVIQEITGFDPAGNIIYFESLEPDQLYGDIDQYYSIVNHVYALDRAGEYVVDETNNRIFYWPRGDIDSCELSISTRSYGIGINGNSHICIEGFTVRGYTNDGAAQGIWNNRTWGDPSQDIVIKNNEITNIRTKDGRKGSISASNINGAIIENNYIHNCQRNSGILAGIPNVIIRNNRINKVGYKGIWTIGANNLQILNNTIDECNGTHGNPISIFTTTNSLIADNYFQSNASEEIFTFEGNHNMVLHNNIIFANTEGGEETGTNIVRQNGATNHIDSGYIVFTNNTILYSRINNGIGITQYFEDLNNVIIRNNITDGGIGGTSAMEMSRSNNIYTGLSWSQEERYGWSLMEGESVENNLDTIFIDHQDDDFRLKENSPARNTGINLTSIIPTEITNLFPEYDFSRDYLGNQRGLDGSWDIGAYEYVEGGIISSPIKLHLAYPNPFTEKTTINYSSPVTCHLSLIIYDMLGRKVRTLVDEEKPAGTHTTEWDGTDLHGKKVPSGIYFYQISGEEKGSTAKKMIFLK